MIRKWLVCLLCYQIIFSSDFVNALQNPIPSGKEKSAIALKEPYLPATSVSGAGQVEAGNEKQVNDKILSNTKDWTDKKKSLLPAIIEAVSRLDDYTSELEAQRGQPYVQDLLEGNRLILHDADLNSELTYRMIDGVRVPRLMIDNEIYLIVDRNLLSETSNHLKRYIYRVHFEAGGKGRRVNLVLLNSSEGDSIETRYLLRPKVTNYRWWKEYFLSKYKTPTKSDVTLAIATGAGLHAGLAKLVSFVTDQPIPTEAIMWTVTYSGIYGTFISTIRNWTILSGSRATRVLKSQMVSMLFAYGLVVAVGSGDFAERLSTIGIFSLDSTGFAWNPEGIALNLSVFANGIMNNFTKDFWNQIPRLREVTRANAGFFDFKIEWLNKMTQWKRATIEGQMIYLIPWTINFLALTTLATTDWLKIPGTGITFPLFQFVSVPFAMLWAKTYSRKLANQAKADPDLKAWSRELEEKATEHERMWDKTFGAKLSELPGNAKDWTRDILKSTKGKISTCLRDLVGRSD